MCCRTEHRTDTVAGAVIRVAAVVAGDRVIATGITERRAAGSAWVDGRGGGQRWGGVEARLSGGGRGGGQLD